MSAPPESPSVESPFAHPHAAWYGGPARRTSRAAVLGLVLAVLLPPVGLVASSVAVGRTGAGRAKGRALAVAGLVVSVLGTLVWTVVLLALLTGSGTAEEASAQVVAAPEADAGQPGGAADAGPGAELDGTADVAADLPDPSEFEVLTPEAWAEVARYPDSRRGDAISVFAEVFDLDDSGKVLVNAGASQPAAGAELDDAALVSLPAVGAAGLAEGDVVRVDAVVDGSRSYDTVDGGENTVVALRALAVEPVGYLDLTPDVTLGTPAPERFGGVDVPVSVVNSGGTTYNFDVTVTAVSPDGATTYASTSAYVDDLTAGRTGQGVASFLEPVPADAVYSVTAVDRYAA